MIPYLGMETLKAQPYRSAHSFLASPHMGVAPFGFSSSHLKVHVYIIEVVIKTFELSGKNESHIRLLLV